MADSIIIALITAGFPTLTTAITAAIAAAQDVYITRIVGIRY